jgi:hypothetical protein
MSTALVYLKKKTDLIDRQVENLASTARKLEVELNKLLAQGTKAGRTIDVALARQNIQNLMIESGYYEAGDKILNEGTQELIDLTYEQYKKQYGVSLQYTDQSLDRIRALKDLKVEKFNTITEGTINDLNKILIDQQFGAIDLTQATGLLKQVLEDDHKKYAETVIRQTQSALDREASNLLATDGGFKLFEFIGPSDQSTSEQCLEYLGQVKTEEEWMAEGGDYPVFIYGSHPNCRHSFMPVIPEDFKEE